jgi:hypothetical protein
MGCALAASCNRLNGVGGVACMQPALTAHGKQAYLGQIAPGSIAPMCMCLYKTGNSRDLTLAN